MDDIQFPADGRNAKGRFVAGQSGNPKGAPKKSRPLYNALLDEAERLKREESMNIWQEVARKIFQLARTGEQWAIVLLDKHYGGYAPRDSKLDPADGFVNQIRDLLEDGADDITLLAAAKVHRGDGKDR